MDPPDRELVAQAAAGRREAFDALVERHGPAVYSLLARLCAGRDLAQDLFQETFLRAYLAIDRLQDPTRLRGWLARIATNVFRRHRERDARRPATLPFEHADEAAGGGTALDAAEHEERRRALRRAVENLPERQRAVLSLRVDLELPYREIARMLEITEENARACHYQALKNLRRRLVPEASRGEHPGRTFRAGGGPP